MNRLSRCKLLIALGVAVLSLSPFSFAQLPGMDPDEKGKEAKPAVENQQTAEAEKPGAVRGVYNKFLGEESPWRPVVLTVVTLLVLLRLKRYATKKLRTELETNAFFKENVKGFFRTWNRLWFFATAILVLMAMSGSVRALGLTAGFFGMMLGWSLQQPVTGVAAWLMIVMKKPFKIGDRIVVAGMTGDVTGITLTHVVLNQVGGSVGGEERSGRGILIPNAILFNNVIINYTLSQDFMLDEVPVRLTFDSDWERANEILISAAKEVTADIIANTKQEPFIRAEFLEWGVLIRLRYNTVPQNRQEVSTRIIERILKAFKEEFPRVRFAIPSQTIRHRPESEQGSASAL